MAVRVNDAVFGVVLILAAIAIFLEARTFPAMPGQRFGAALVPTLLAGGFALCGLSLIWTGLRRREVHGLVELGPWARQGGHILDVGLVIGGIALLIALWERVGFLIGGTLLAWVLMIRFRGGRPVTSLLLAVGAGLALDFGFRRLLLVPLPLGPLTGIVW
jgi:putative tricarboxylic transport membrane protein